MYNFQIINQSSDIKLSDQWKDSSVFQNKDNLFNEKGQKVTAEYEGVKYRLISKKERRLSCFERFYRILLGSFAVLFSLGCSLSSKKVRRLFTNKTVKMRYAVSTPKGLPEPQARVIKCNRPVPEPQSGVIKNGYGEYLIYRIQNNARVPINEEEYLKIYDLIEKYRTRANGDNLEDSHTYLKGKIQEQLGQDVNIAFIPRTLYELIYLRQCFKEELDDDCNKNAQHLRMNAAFRKGPDEVQEIMKKGFWQICHFDDKDYDTHFAPKTDFDYRYNHIKKIAAKLNEVALTLFKESCNESEGFTLSEINDVKREIVSFCKELQNPTSALYKQAKEISANVNLAVTQVFSLGCSDKFIKNEHPLNISSVRCEQIIDKAVQLECSVGSNDVILYRGGNFIQDGILRRKSSPNMLSFGNSLFAGVLYDQGACAFHYMRRTDCDAQAFVLPLKELLANKIVFQMHQVHPLIQLMSQGEFFHGRTKIWKVDDNADIFGYITLGSIKYSQLKGFCKTEMTQEEAEKSFESYRTNAYALAQKD